MSEVGTGKLLLELLGARNLEGGLADHESRADHKRAMAQVAGMALLLGAVVGSMVFGCLQCVQIAMIDGERDDFIAARNRRAMLVHLEASDGNVEHGDNDDEGA